MKKFCVTGITVAELVGKKGDKVRTENSTFDRIVYADDAKSARDMVHEAVKAKRSRSTRYYDVRKLTFESLEVFECVISEVGG